jgi:hypothetical protein
MRRCHQPNRPRVVGLAAERLKAIAQVCAAKRLDSIAQGFSPGLAGPASALKVAPEEMCVPDWVSWLDLVVRLVTSIR